MIMALSLLTPEAWAGGGGGKGKTTPSLHDKLTSNPPVFVELVYYNSPNYGVQSSDFKYELTHPSSTPTQSEAQPFFPDSTNLTFLGFCTEQSKLIIRVPSTFNAYDYEKTYPDTEIFRISMPPSKAETRILDQRGLKTIPWIDRNNRLGKARFEADIWCNLKTKSPTANKKYNYFHVSITPYFE